jgi:hypothetical protein
MIRNWSTLRGVLTSQSIIGILAILISAANAPVFENIGSQAESELKEKLLLALFYTSVFVACFLLVVARIICDTHCPLLIKQFRTVEIYVGEIRSDVIDSKYLEALETRNQRIKDWKADNALNHWGQSASLLFLLVLLLILFSFLAAVASLWIFALR